MQRVHTSLTAGSLVLLAATALAGCGSTSKPSVGDLSGKLKAESQLTGLTSAQLTCVANVVHRYGRSSDLEKYVQGRESLSAVQGAKRDQDTATKQIEACAAAR